jgi:AcrR family transcriptional regulator
MSTTDPQSRRPSRRERNARGEGGRLRDELVDAASALIAETGTVESVSLRAVARRAGVSAPSVYLHFDDREGLIQGVVERRFRDLIRYVQEGSAAGASGADDPVGALRGGTRGYVRFGIENPGHYRVLFDTDTLVEPFDEAAGDAAREAFGSLVEAIGRCQRAGLARPGDTYARATATWSAMHGMVLLRLAKPHFDWPPLEDLLEDVLVGLVGIPPLEPS